MPNDRMLRYTVLMETNGARIGMRQLAAEMHRLQVSIQRTNRESLDNLAKSLGNIGRMPAAKKAVADLERLRNSGNITATQLDRLGNQFEIAATKAGIMGPRLQKVGDELHKLAFQGKDQVNRYKEEVAAINQIIATHERYQEQLRKEAALEARRAQRVADIAARDQRIQEARARAAEERANRKTQFGNSQGAQQNLQKVGSAVQGFMVTASAMQGNVTGLAFSLIFLQFSMFKVAAAAAVLTAAIMGPAKLVAGLLKLEWAANKASIALEQSGQSMAIFFQSAAEAQRLETMASQVSRVFGIVREESRGMLYELSRIGAHLNDTAIKAVLNTAGATRQTASSVAKDIVNLMMSSSTSIEGALERFNKQYNIQASSLNEVFTALEQRFKYGAEAMAQTQQGLKTRIKETFTDLMISMGAIVDAVIKPTLDVILAFAEAMLGSFQELRKGAEVSGELNSNLKDVKEALKTLIPIATRFGHFVGSVLFNALMLSIRAYKLLISTIRAGARFIKEVVDLLRAVASRIKDGVSPIEKAVIPIGALAGAFKGLAEVLAGLSLKSLATFADDLLHLRFDKIALGLTKNLGAVLRGAISGAIAGLALFFVEQLTLELVERSNLSDSIKEKLTPALELGFLAAAVGIVFGPIGAAIGLGLGTAIGYAVESLRPGTIQQLSDLLGQAWDGALNFFRSGEATSLWEANVTPKVNTMVDSVGEVFGKIYNWIKERLLPALRDFGDWLLRYVVDPLLRFGGWIASKFQPILEALAEAIRTTLSDAWGTVNRIVQIFVDLLDLIGDLWEGKVGTAIKALGGYLGDTLGPVFKVVGDAIDAIVTFMIDLIAKWIEFQGLTNPFALINTVIDGVRTSVDLLIEGFKTLATTITNLPKPSMDWLNPGTWIDSLNPWAGAVGGVVPGLPGTKQLVLAEAGERFMGNPSIANGRPGSSGGAGSVIQINVQITDSVVTDQAAMDKLASKVGDSIVRRLAVARPFTQHRI